MSTPWKTQASDDSLSFDFFSGSCDASMDFFVGLRRALAFLTLLPVGPKVEAGPFDIATDARYFPVAGAGIGVFSASVFWLTGQFWPQPVAVFLCLMTAIILTGGLHEDGLADTADGFGGGWTRERRLAIMKDSHIGTYGVLALIFALALKAAALASLPSSLISPALVALHAGGRMAIVLVLTVLDYAGDPQTAKSPHLQKRLAIGGLVFPLGVTVLSFLPLFYFDPRAAVLGAVFGSVACALLAAYSGKAIGGYCGDVLGAIEQTFEVFFLLGLCTMR